MKYIKRILAIAIIYASVALPESNLNLLEWSIWGRIVFVIPSAVIVLFSIFESEIDGTGKKVVIGRDEEV